MAGPLVMRIETPSWAYANCGTRFGVVKDPAAPRDAYEKVADAAQVHQLIRFQLGRHGVERRIPILYGGSVNQGNVLALLAREELDGVLVGGASLEPDGWAELVGLGG